MSESATAAPTRPAPPRVVVSQALLLAHFPWLTLALIAGLVALYFGFQGGPPTSRDEILRLGAKSPVLIVELGEWWRLLVANALHTGGLHLGINCLFLLNLGGPAEALFRRVDYLIVILASALGTTGLSSLMTSEPSCGASGVVFGLWGAVAVFGIRHHRWLPDRYRRYFAGSVIPYALIALYLGLVTPGVDNWGHLGGLLTGSAVASQLPARLLGETDRFAAAKLAGLALGFFALALLSMSATGFGDTASQPLGHLTAPMPTDWSLEIDRFDENAEAYRLDNGTGIILELRSHADDTTTSGADAGWLSTQAPRGEAEERAFSLAGLSASRRTVQLSGGRHWEGVAVHYAGRNHLVALSGPEWLTQAYNPAFLELLGRVERERGLEPSP